MEKVFEIYIRTTPERLWQAITDGEMRSKYSWGIRVRSVLRDPRDSPERLGRLSPRPAWACTRWESVSMTTSIQDTVQLRARRFLA